MTFVNTILLSSTACILTILTSNYMCFSNFLINTLITQNLLLVAPDSYFKFDVKHFIIPHAIHKSPCVPNVWDLLLSKNTEFSK